MQFKHSFGLLSTIACVIMICALAGCAGVSLRPNDTVMDSFRGAPKADHAYFLAGTEENPDGIIGIDTAYTLDPGLWKPIDPSRLQEIVKTMRDRAVEATASISVGDMVTKDGVDIGDWVLYLGDSPYVKVKGRQVIVYPPGGLHKSSGGGGASGGGGCFPGGTKILMADGSVKEIQDITKRDRVMSYSFQDNRAMPDEVAEQYCVEREGGLYRLNGSLCVTGEHPFYEEADDSRTKKVMSLKQNQEVVGDSDSHPDTLEKIPLENIEELDGEGRVTVFNMRTGTNHNFFVSDNQGNFFLVHNKGGGQ